MNRKHSALVLAAAVAMGGLAACHDADKSSSAQAALANVPDWSGLWDIEATRPDSTGGYEHSLAEVADGMRKWGPPPYTDAIRPLVEKAEAFRARQVRNDTENGPSNLSGSGTGACAFGLPMLMLSSPLMFEALTTPKETVLIFSGREVRHIYTDGRPHPSKEDLWPSYWGDSVGHWEGDTLVVDTVSVQSPLGSPRSPTIPILAMGGKGDEVETIALLSRQAHFVERIRMIDGHLEDQMTITDPVMFSAPWHVSRTYARVTGVNRMVYEDCSGDTRNPIVNGKLTIAPPPGPPPPPPPELAPLYAVLAKAAN
jgi:hypothetical protein